MGKKRQERWIPTGFERLLRTVHHSGSGKHRPKEPKKKNKQRLRFRAQNQHSDHLASARSSQ
ncbi:hypothetical protein INR49_026659 [Caranx melampygus]|nr:hypothetical protein INR49_026659 [Caranx melampygus]